MTSATARLALLVLLACASTAYGRNVLQTSSNQCPNGCNTCIPDPAATNGVRCQSCAGGRIPAIDGTCGCRRGQRLVTDNSVTPGQKKCEPCPQGSFCLGGTEAQSPDSTSCGTGLTTNNAGAGSAAACVTRAGYKYVPATAGSVNNMPTATACEVNTYNTGGNRLKECIPCRAGLRTRDVGVNTGGTGSESSAACKVPSGWYASSGGKVIRCPRGQYRTGLNAVGSGTAKCDRCAEGTSTTNTASTAQTDCKVLLPGYTWTSTTPYTTTGRRLQQTTTPPAVLCPWKHYCPGDAGTSYGNSNLGRTKCPNGLWTRTPGARSSADCQVPPGHKFTGTDVEACSQADGEYRAEWATPSGTTAIDCNKCGTNIKSENVEPVNTFPSDANNQNTEGSDPRSPVIISRPVTPASCYIEQGEGMVYEDAAQQTFRKVTCNGNNYGIARAKAYGLTLSPCTDCPKGTVTVANSADLKASNDQNYKNSANGGFYDPAACKTLPGYGFDGTQATMCPQGYWNDGTSDPADECKQCPTGTTTPSVSLSALSDARSNCKVLLPGYGHSARTSAAASATEANKILNILDQTDGVFACPLGRYRGTTSTNMDTDNGVTCTACPTGRTTRDTASTSVSNCDVCEAGKGFSGTPSDTHTCTACQSGTYGPDSRSAGSYACIACPTKDTNVFQFTYANSDNTYSPAVISVEGATSISQCMLKFAAIEDGNWYLPSADSLTETTLTGTPTGKSGRDACMEQCGTTCAYATWDWAANKCYRRLVATESATDTKRIAYKVLPNANLALRRSAQPSAVGSGFWSWWQDGQHTSVGTLIVKHTTNSNTKTIKACLEACNDNSECAGVKFVFKAPDATNKMSDAANFESCELFKGEVVPLGTLQTLVQTRLSTTMDVTKA